MSDPIDRSAARRDLAALRRCFAAAAALAPVLLLSGCGGGGADAPGTAGSSAPPASAPAPASPSPSPTPSPAPLVLSTCGYSDFAARALQRVNALRASGAVCGSTNYPAVAALTWSGTLTQAADGHSQDMAAQNYFSHTSLDGRTFDQRISAAGYTWRTAGENIAAGYGGVDAVMDGWIGSEGHCKNLMNAGFTEIGLACVPGTSGDTYANYWTMDLAAPR